MPLRSGKVTPGRKASRIPTPRQTMVSQAEVEALIAAALNAHEATLTASGRLLPVEPPGGRLPAPAPAPAPTTGVLLCQYVTDPYKGDFCPGEKGGAILFNKATEELKESEKFTFNQDKAINLLAEMKSQSERFKWGKHINSVQVFPEDLNEAVDKNNIKSLLIQPNLIPLTTVRMHAAACWGTYNLTATTRAAIPTSQKAVDLDPATKPADLKLFYERTRRTMIAKAILGMLKPSAKVTIMLKKDIFRWTDTDGDTHDDGPTLLKLIFLEVNPATKVSLQTHKNTITAARLGGYGNNVSTMLNAMECAYDIIISNSGSHDDYIMHIFQAILSSKNQTFKNYMQTYKDKWEEDEPITANEIIAKAKSKYANMHKEKSWGKNDPKDTQLLALQTKVEKLEGTNKKNKYNGKSTSGTPKTPGTTNSCINPERMKKCGPTKMIDGKLQYWCTQHVCPKGRYDGLYCNHDDLGHPDWQKRKDEFKANKKKGKPSQTGVQTSTNGRSFKLTDKLKTALCTQGQMSAEQVEEILGTDFS